MGADEAAILDAFGDGGGKKGIEDELFADAEEEEDIEIREEITDTFDDVTFETTAEVETFTQAVLSKLNKSKCPNATHKFIYELVKAMEKEMKIAECEALQKTLTNLLKEKRKTSAQKAMSEKKANDITKKNAKIDIHSEMNMMYGDGDDDDDYWEEEKKEEEKK